VLALRRFAAFAVDYLVIVAWGAVLVGIALVSPWTSAEPSADPAAKIAGHAFAFLTMTIPVWLYFSLCEGLGRHAALGKLALGLAVEGGLGAAMIRNALRFLPWEIAHAGIWHVPGRPYLDPMPGFDLALMYGALGLAGLLFVSILLDPARGLHDRLARTRVSG
jgi:uncharacterized RDD family membrane protein YckC